MFGKEKRLAKIDAKYIRGHSLYAHEKGTDVSFYLDRMVFSKMNVVIPYNKITKLGAQEDRHITKTRVFLTGVFPGLFWKKKYRYTVIEYNDGIQDQSVILDFHKEADKAQKLIYSRMIEARDKQKALANSIKVVDYKVLEDTNNNKEKQKELEIQETEKLKTEEQQSQEQKEFEEFKKWKAQQAEKEKMMMEDSKE